ncbi:MAG: HAMP domain-containing histidine kinase [Muribaculum sp.]|nr:HAMP domain-containing histidine kinase [Muribaculum sp.]
MTDKSISRLHWKLYFPLVGLLWLIIGITIFYFVSHEKQRQRENLENRLLNVNNTVIDAYERDLDLQNTVEFIRLFTDNTTLAPLRITVYDNDGNMVADNPAATIDIYDSEGHPYPELLELVDENNSTTVIDMKYDDIVNMVCSKTSADGRIHSFAALPYEGEVLVFLGIDPMVWVVVVLLGVLISVIAYFGVRAVCRNVYALRDFAQAIASDSVPENIDLWNFSNDELGDVSRNLLSLYQEKMHAEQEKLHHERQISMNVSHELNTPVGIIKGYIDTVISDENMPDEVRHTFLIRIQQNADRLANLVKDVRLVMRLSETDSTLQCSAVDFGQLLSQLSEDVVQGHIADGMTFTYNLPEPCYVNGHESLLNNAILNLVYNAVKYSGGTTMSLDWVEEKGGRHVFTFTDNGVGVDEKHIGRLFDLFYRVDVGRSRKTGGSGLGLPLVMKIIKSMGGDIKVENAAGGGLKFTFTLPVACTQHH